MPNHRPDASGKAEADKPKPRHFRLRNRLKEKASGGAKVLAELMELAGAEFANMSEDYPDWVSGYAGSIPVLASNVFNYLAGSPHAASPAW